MNVFVDFPREPKITNESSLFKTNSGVEVKNECLSLNVFGRASAISTFIIERASCTGTPNNEAWFNRSSRTNVYKKCFDTIEIKFLIAQLNR